MELLMSKVFKQTSIALISIVSLLGISNTTQAASFTFDLNSSGFNGYLRFTSSPLTGIGAETANLNQLPNAQFSPHLYFSGPRTYRLTDNPVFDFKDGQLAAIRASYYLSEPPRHDKYSSTEIFGGLNLKGITWVQDVTSITTSNAGPGSPLYFPPQYRYNSSNGTISFQTLEPIASNPVPEPSTVLGVALGVAGIMGLRPRFR